MSTRVVGIFLCLFQEVTRKLSILYVSLHNQYNNHNNTLDLCINQTDYIS